MSIVTSLGYLGLLAAPAAAFWRLPCKSTLVVERADPIINPGNISGHVHQIMGGNGFDFEMDFADTQASTCTSCTVHGDFSNYWTPVLYYQHEDNTFEKVDQMGGGLVYYLQRTGPNKDKLEAFPEGLRMVSGDPFKRSAGDDFASQAISYACLDYDKSPGNPETPGFPNLDCPNGLRSQVFFPSCWDGVNLDSADHKSHMAFPIGAYNDGSCPDTHPRHLISIFYEILWDTTKFKDMWYGDSQPFVWAQGDPTGYGFHGDFLMGWDKAILQQAVDECTNDSGRVEDCPVFELYPDSTAEGCKQASRIDEDVQGPFAQLPGCNPITSGPENATPVTNCASNATIGEGKSFFKDLTSSGWGYQGCGKDDYYSRALTGATTSQDTMTNEECVKFCGDEGFSIAGSEYGRECYCANEIPAAAAPIPGVVGNCDMPCAGDDTQMCGASGSLSLYQKCTGDTCSNSADVGGTKPASGSSSATGSAPSTSAPAAYPSTSASVSIANPSSGNAVTKVQSTSATPEGSDVASTPSPSSTTANATPTSSASPSTPTNPTSGLTENWSYLTCLPDALNPRTLPKLAPYTLDDKLVTSTTCVSYCASQGYILAGTEYGGECWCSSTVPSNMTGTDEGECDMACKGDGTQKCGGAGLLSLFGDASAVAKRAEPRKASWIKRDVEEVKGHMKRHAHGDAHHAGRFSGQA